MAKKPEKERLKQTLDEIHAAMLKNMPADCACVVFHPTGRFLAVGTELLPKDGDLEATSPAGQAILSAMIHTPMFMDLCAEAAQRLARLAQSADLVEFMKSSGMEEGPKLGKKPKAEHLH